VDGEGFSRRRGYRRENPDITIHEAAPEEVRAAILSIAEADIGLHPSFIRDVLCRALRTLPDTSNWSEYPNIWRECQDLIRGCPWYRVYDFIEILYRQLDEKGARLWEGLINEYFVEAGVGWHMVNGVLQSRGPQSFGVTVGKAQEALGRRGLGTARDEVSEALRDLSRRPEPDLTGAVQHAMAAFECVAREVVGDPRATLGEILNRYPGLVPKPLDDAMAKMWGYASENARHLREGRTLSRPEVEFLVEACCAAVNYLVSKAGA